MAEKEKTYFKVLFKDPKDGKIMTLKAQKIEDSSLGLGFICISKFLFEQSSLVIDPDDDLIKQRLENVKTLHLSIYSILSIQEMGGENKGLKFKKDKSNLLVLPSPK